MYMEDIVLGNRIYSRITRVPAGTTVNFNGNAKRVGIKLITVAAGNNNTAYAAIFPIGLNNSSSFLFVNSFGQYDQISVQSHGSLVYGQFSCEANVSNAVVIEFLLDDHGIPPERS